jgi:MFS family permease
MLINRSYAKLWSGQAVSAAGDRVAYTTLVLWVSQVLAAGRSWGPAAVSGLLVAAGAACILAGPVAGVFVDRWDRRSVMAWSEAIRAVLAGGLAGMSFTPVRALPPGAWLAGFYTAVFTLTAAGQFADPARLAATGDLVHGEAEQVRAVGLAEAAASAAGVIGPPVAALLFYTIGARLALAVNAASYLVSWMALRSLPRGGGPRPAAASRGGLRAEWAAGLRTFRRSSTLTALLTVTVICQLGTGALSALNVFFVITDLHASGRVFGVAEMTIGAGFIVGALSASRLVRRAGPRGLTWSCLLAAGVLAAGYGMQRSVPAALAVLAAYAVLLAVLNTAVKPLLLTAAPRAYLGRVMAIWHPVNQLASTVSVIVWGWLASTVLHGFRASVAGVTINSVSLIFLLAGGLIIASGIRALTTLPPAPRLARRPPRT